MAGSRPWLPSVLRAVRREDLSITFTSCAARSPSWPRRPCSFVVDSCHPMDYEFLTHLRRNHPAWRLLAADQGPFVIGFLYHGYVRTNTRALSEPEVVSHLDDYLHHLREHHGEQAPSRTARDYLADWADND